MATENLPRNKGGAPHGNQNRLVHGRYMREMREFRARVRAHIREARAHCRSESDL